MVDVLPDLASLSDVELKKLIEELQREEAEISFRRRMLHGKIDILRAELVFRLQKQIGEGRGPLDELDVKKLTAILTSKASPPSGAGA